ncbi:MAG: hypothetical protein KF760_24485 [Candidatus Eremiobacteraeota bacterium]|nr:hypothetical protein [Candidatus Eremiobacteraeota bacterium]
MSERQRLILLWAMPVIRALVLLFIVLLAMSGADLSHFVCRGCHGNIGG